MVLISVRARKGWFKARQGKARQGKARRDNANPRQDLFGKLHIGR
jgi:hypothetical protein